MDIVVFITVLLVIIAYCVYIILMRGKRRAYILHYNFPESIKEKISSRYPHLLDSDLERVLAALKQYFRVCNMAGKRMVAMPSQVVDIAWHEFILFTRLYDEFCKKGLGRFLHHTPAEAMESPIKAQNGIKRAWRLTCELELLDPQSPKRVPLLFAIDAELQIPDGFHYLKNCVVKDKEVGDKYCCSHIGCGGGCGGGCSGGCAGGCGGS